MTTIRLSPEADANIALIRRKNTRLVSTTAAIEMSLQHEADRLTAQANQRAVRHRKRGRHRKTVEAAPGRQATPANDHEPPEKPAEGEKPDA